MKKNNHVLLNDSKSPLSEMFGASRSSDFEFLQFEMLSIHSDLFCNEN